MNLLNKISIWFIGIVVLTTPLSMYVSSNNIKKRIDNAEIERLKSVNAQVAAQLKALQKPDVNAWGRTIDITVLQGPLPQQTTEITQDCDKNTGLQQNECLIRVNSYVLAGSKAYRISSFSYTTNTSQILKGMLSTVLWKMLLIAAVVFITGRLLSRYVLKPFRHAMEAIRHFSLAKKEKIQLIPTSTKEFLELNEFLQKMTDKAVEDYAAVKEFSENASHELQTPVAVIRNKLELLSETDIDARQASLIEDMQNALEKLRRINRSLTLLTRLDNQEFATEKNIYLCKVANDALATFSDRIAMKNISVVSNLENDVLVKIHPVLAEILITNLLVNAIRHNLADGSISIDLTRKRFLISNTGLPPEIPTEELFQRFRKSNQSGDSIGLGLAIVKQICEVSHFPVCYHYRDGWHTVSVYFSNDEDPDLSGINPAPPPVSRVAVL